MEKLEKYRKLCKYVQLFGMIAIVGGGLVLVFFLQRANQQSQTLLLTYSFAIIVVLLAFMLFVNVPMQNNLLKKIILESLNGLVTDVKFNKKKGYNRESFNKLKITNKPFNQYGCQDYYSFNYNNMLIESTTVRAYDEIKVDEPRKNNKNKTKKVKKAINYFYGRIYVIPIATNQTLNIYGKKNPTMSRKKEMENDDYCNEYPLKIKKYNENFEVFYKGDKPSIDVQSLLEKLYSLKLAAKGTIYAFIRKKNMVICIDNGHYYAEVETKNPIDESIVRGYRKDVNMVLTFINSMKVFSIETKEEESGEH